MPKKSPAASHVQSRKDTFTDYLCIAGIVGIMIVGSVLSFTQLMAWLQMLFGKG